MRITILMIGLLGSLASMPAAVGQVAAESQQVEQSIVRVFALKYADAADCIDVLQTLLGNHPSSSIACDYRTNSLIVRSTPSSLDEVGSLIELLDRESSPSEDEQIKVISISDNKLSNGVEVLRALELPLAIAVDPDRGLILRGRAQDLQVAEALLLSLNEKADSETQDVAIEIMWLSESKTEGASPLQSSLSRRLRDRGFGDLFVMSIIEVSAQKGGRCTAQGGSAAQGNMRCEIALGSIGDLVSMDLLVEATYPSTSGMQSLLLESAVSTPLNKWLVFAVAQRNSSTANDEQMGRDLILVQVKEAMLLE